MDNNTEINTVSLLFQFRYRPIHYTLDVRQSCVCQLRFTGYGPCQASTVSLILNDDNELNEDAFLIRSAKV